MAPGERVEHEGNRKGTRRGQLGFSGERAGAPSRVKSREPSSSDPLSAALRHLVGAPVHVQHRIALPW